MIEFLESRDEMPIQTHRISKLSLQNETFLLQYLTEKAGKPILGGVVLSCANSRIVCSNTLDDRLELSLQEFLPDIRNGLFKK